MPTIPRGVVPEVETTERRPVHEARKPLRVTSAQVVVGSKTTDLDAQAIDRAIGPLMEQVGIAAAEAEGEMELRIVIAPVQ